MKIISNYIIYINIIKFFLFNASNEEEFPELRINYIMATCFISTLLFFLYIKL